jgi:peptidoglycan L-alanyl-D-glutamate endopeptidase CwlK
MIGVDQRLVDVAHQAIQLSKVDFGIPSTGGMRTLADQMTLHKEGKSPCDGVYKRSYHQTGKALDVFAWVNGHISYEEEHLTTIAAAFLQCAAYRGLKLYWGGHFQSYTDMPHFEIHDIGN